jgi:cysteine synthase
MSARELIKPCRYGDLIGNTPLLDLTHLASPQVDGVRVLAKAEFMNPGFSIKDRIASHILSEAEKEGVLKPGGTVVAASSGNTGAATAMICAMRGYKAVIITSAKCSQEKRDAITAYGAELLVQPCVPSSDPRNYMNVARTYLEEHPDAFDMDQYDNPRNPRAYILSLGPEIMEQTGGKVTHFVAAGSTGGTISGTGRYLKSVKPDVQVVLSDPIGSIFYQYFRNGEVGRAEPFLVEGVGKGNIPKALNMGVVDQSIRVTDGDAFSMCHYLAHTEGIMAGGSAGLNVFAALQLANSVTEPATIVTVMPDGGLKYLSKVYSHEWLAAHGVTLDLARCAHVPAIDDVAATLREATALAGGSAASGAGLDATPSNKPAAGVPMAAAPARGPGDGELDADKA